MDFLEIKKKIDLVDDLPGWLAHKDLSPPYRKKITIEEINEKLPRKASVIIILYKRDNQIFFPLILRSIYEGTHSGQIGLPGGKKDKDDLNNEETAIREAHEELGIEKEKLEIVKKMSPLYVPPSNFYVHPYIAFYRKEGNFEFVPDDKEVQQVYEIQLDKFLKQTNIIIDSGLVEKYNQHIPAFNYEKLVIWGATAMILNEFKYLLK